MNIFVLLLSAFALLAAPCRSDLTVLQSDEGFTVAYKGRTILEHTISAPVLTLGSGNTSFEQSSGNFAIEENVYAAISLGSFAVVTERDTFVQIDLATNTVPDLQATINLQVVSGPSNGSEFDSVIIQAAAIDPLPENINRLWLKIYAEKSEKIFGGGEQYTYFNLRGRDYPIWTREQGVGRGDGVVANVSNSVADAGGSYHTTYWPQSSFFSSRLYTALIWNNNYMVLNFTPTDYHEFFVHSASLTLELEFDNTALGLVQKVYKRAGTQPPLPDWVLGGAILGLEDGTEEALYYYNLAKEAGVNVSALWLQDWSGYIQTAFGHRVYWNWAWNSTYYPGLDEVVQELATDGVRVTVYCNPHLIQGSPMFEEAAAAGHLMRDRDGQIFLLDFGGFYGGTVDVHYTPSMEWYAERLKTNIFDLGFAGYMADFGEYTDIDMVSRNTELNAEETHNYYPLAWANVNRLAVQAAGLEGEAVYWMRSGALGAGASQTLAWAGDQDVDFSTTDGVATTIVAALSLGLSGMGFTHFDIGGYTTQPPMVRTQELFLRSAEYAVFTPVMRTHLGNKPDANHQFYSSNDTLTQFARLTQIHARLQPYAAAFVKETSLLGIPLQRPLFLHYESESQAWNTQEEYLYGRDLLVAPVLNRGQESVEVYLPRDEWVHLFAVTAAIVGPASLIVDAPMGYPPVFYRRDSEFADLFRSITDEFGLP